MSGSSHQIACPQCGAFHELRGKAMTVAATCKSCKIYFRTGTWERATAEFRHTEYQAIPLGAKGRIENYLYEVLGFIVKEETRYKYRWREYFLFNPFRGYAFLSEYNGHWNFIWPIENDPRVNTGDDDFYYGDIEQEFRLYQKYTAQVVFATGEFFFDVMDMTANTVNHEYIAPPHMFALERSDDSVLWCQGEYFFPEEIARIFSLPRKKLPSTSGIGYTQPLNTSFSEKSLILFTFVALLITLSAQLFFNNSAQDQVILRGDYSRVDLKDEQKMFVTPSFTLNDGTKNLEIFLDAPLTNDWFFGEFALINEDKGIEYNFTKEIEYYSGYEDGEAWSEGSKSGEAILSQIPSGRYHLNIYPEFSVANSSFSLEVRRDVPTTMNFWITCLGLLAFPIFYYIRKHYREQSRWADSDYSPYGTE
jgi:hypothetical protein